MSSVDGPVLFLGAIVGLWGTLLLLLAGASAQLVW
jgi:hypothetical protein